MLKSKHSGWTWELKRTPYGSGNPISAITDPISSALGTDGGGGGALGALADIDPGPAIGQGWTTVGAAALAGTGLYFAPELMAALGAEGVAAGEASFIAADGANLAAQGLSQAAIAQNLAAGYGLSEAAAAAAASAALPSLCLSLSICLYLSFFSFSKLISLSLILPLFQSIFLYFLIPLSLFLLSFSVL